MLPRLLLTAFAALLAWSLPAWSQEAPQPPVVTPGAATVDTAGAPSDALILFNGKDMDGWTRRGGEPAQCQVDSGVMRCASGSGDIQTRRHFHSAQIHLEFATPNMPEQKGQMRGNSGLYLQGRYELQILDSYRNSTYAHGHLGALYGQAPPLANAARPPEEWQSYDVIFHGPRCDTEGSVIAKATVTAILNGVLVQDHVAINASEKLGKGCTAGPLLLQDHSGFPNAPHTVMKFRNVWLRPLDSPAQP